eukprot:CAMPEP_0179182078 /NCGR_PEP_ID=MMETSP0796-20121207/90206_1 /TAXON_ID=73915 /ORGANISM="Pyrodinium bahamense, Strain pbaha01" /LENGTH=69 /DNA_ID=CAMNT_0020885901 /DNA_START=874 /DNA_END=1083 /DNA_ORIENTATION=-
MTESGLVEMSASVVVGSVLEARTCNTFSTQPVSNKWQAKVVRVPPAAARQRIAVSAAQLRCQLRRGPKT